MAEAPYRFPRARAERTIAATRIAIASFSLYAVWLDPAQPARFVQLTYLLHVGCIAYSLVLAAVMWRRPSTGWLPIATHIIDIIVFSVAQYFTLGPSSPFFNYFIFSLFCAAVRWGWRGTLATAPIVGVAYLGIALANSYILGATDFDLNRFIIRSGNLVVFSVLLVYLGRHEARLRDDIRRLAGWPATVGDDAEAEIKRVIAYAAGVVAARQVVAIWEPDQEPRVQVAIWRRDAFELSRHASAEFEPWVSDELEDIAFLYSNGADARSATTTRGRRISLQSDAPIHPSLAAHVTPKLVASAAFRTERLTGRVFFGDLDDATTVEILPLVEVVAREIGASIDQREMHSRTRQLAVGEERIRVARDLHDGVLQSLTGVRFELQSLAAHLGSDSLADTRDRLISMERALASEQRELRFFIEDLQPMRAETRPEGTLAARLQELTDQLASQWKTPVTLRMTTIAAPLSNEIEQALPRMIHEAVVNALKHGEPSRVAVTLHGDGDDLRVVITDDGHGFPFEGQFDQEMLMRQNLGPVSLCERVRSLGGAVSVESRTAGSKVEIRLPVAAHA